jgi:hypothetical protein
MSFHLRHSQALAELSSIDGADVDVPEELDEAETMAAEDELDDVDELQALELLRRHHEGFGLLQVLSYLCVYAQLPIQLLWLHPHRKF